VTSPPNLTADLSVPERVLFCVASKTDCDRAGITGAVVTSAIVPHSTRPPRTTLTDETGSRNVPSADWPLTVGGVSAAPLRESSVRMATTQILSVRLSLLGV
jgi:hypothetical protein